MIVFLFKLVFQIKFEQVANSFSYCQSKAGAFCKITFFVKSFKNLITWQRVTYSTI
jgi:hypothetical protein